jgi:hypothetical protein
MLALLKAEKATGFSVIDGPHLDKWRITVADGGYTHRIAEDRYSVTARVGIVRAVVADPGEAGTAMAKNIHGDVPIVKPTMAAELPKPKSAKAAKKKGRLTHHGIRPLSRSSLAERRRAYAYA